MTGSSGERPVRLADFILVNLEPILVEWENFARSIWPAVLSDLANDPSTLRDHADELLRSAVADMRSEQTDLQQSNKSKGTREPSSLSGFLDRASDRHAEDRAGVGLELSGLVSEYRALRATVIRLWRASDPEQDSQDFDDLIRFNESIDQSLTEAIRSFTEQAHREREAMLHSEQAARKDAENANRAKDVFLANLSHEMRTPLSIIIGWITILRLPDHAGKNLAEGLDVLERSTRAQVKLIDDMLDVSRIVSGKLRLEMTDCDLTKSIHAGIDAVRAAAHAKDITLEVHLDPAARNAHCDETRIQQIVWNLLSNAIKFGRKGGIVRVTLDRDGSSWRLSVSDDGHGIPQEFLPCVFERFRQADLGTRRRFGGLGLGLSIVKHLVEMHGGTVEARSDGEGHGATFIVRLPISAMRADETHEEHVLPRTDGDELGSVDTHALPVRLDGLHVLVVDNEADARRVLERALEGIGARVTTASSVVEALAALADMKSKPDILLSDVGMPGQDGYDLIREMRRRGHPADLIPAVALTAFAHDDDSGKALAAGFQIHLAKPVSLSELASAVADLTGRTPKAA